MNEDKILKALFVVFAIFCIPVVIAAGARVVMVFRGEYPNVQSVSPGPSGLVVPDSARIDFGGSARDSYIEFVNRCELDYRLGVTPQCTIRVHCATDGGVDYIAFTGEGCPGVVAER